MTDARTGTLLLSAARLLDRPAPAADAALVGRLAHDRDPAAFAELVARHGPAVWAVCRRLTRSEPDADDVFQATFLVLARHPGRVRKAGSVGSWLHGVAARLGRKARLAAARRPDPHRLTPRPPAPDPAAGPSWAEVRAALDEELAALPDGLRAPLLLCYLDGHTQDEAAAALGLNPRTVKDRVARGREQLRRRLARRGVGLPAALAVLLLAPRWAAAVPARLMDRLAGVADHLTRRRPPGVSAAALALAHSEAPTMTLLRVLLVTVSAAGLAAGGAVVGRGAGPGDDPVAAAVRPPADDFTPEVPPPGAIARIGTTQFRQSGWHHRAFFTADGKTLVAPAEGGKVNLWEAETGRLQGTIPLRKFGVAGADFHPPTNILALFGHRWPDDQGGATTYQVWLVDVNRREVVRTILMADPPRSSNYHRIAFTPDGNRLVGGTDGDLRVWEVTTGEQVARRQVKTGLGAFALSPDGKTAAFGSYDLFLWDWEKDGEPRKFTSPGRVELVAFGPGGKTLYVDIGHGHLTEYDVSTGRRAGRINVHDAPRSLALSPDGKTLAVGYHWWLNAGVPVFRTVTLWDTATGEEVGRLATGRGAAQFVGWSPDGTRLIGVTDHRIWAWDVATGQPLAPTAAGHEGHVGGFAFGPDGRLFTASDDGTVRSWDADTGRPGLTLEQGHWVRAVDVSPDGRLVAGSGLRNDLRVWDARTGAERFKLLGNGAMGGTRLVRFAADGRLVAWGDDQFVRTFDVRTGKLLTEHTTRPPDTEPDPDDPFGDRRELMMFHTRSASLTADGAVLALGGYDGVRLIDTAIGKDRPLPLADPLPPMPEFIALSPDGKRLAVAARARHTEGKQPNGLPMDIYEEDHPVLVYDLAAGKVLWRAAAAGTNGVQLLFTPDGRRLAELVRGKDGPPAVRVWDAGTGKDLGRVALPDLNCWHVAFDRTGRRLAAAFSDTTAAVYDLDRALKPAPK